MTIGERIKMLRIAKKMTQTELADSLKTTKQNIFKYENGIVTNIPSDKIERIAEVLGVEPAIIMGWTEPDISTLTPPLDENEQQLVKIYRNVNEDGQDYIMKTARMVKSAEQYRKPPKQDDEGVLTKVAARSFGNNNDLPEPIRLKKRPGAGSILDLPDYDSDL